MSRSGAVVGDGSDHCWVKRSTASRIATATQPAEIWFLAVDAATASCSRASSTAPAVESE